MCSQTVSPLTPPLCFCVGLKVRDAAMSCLVEIYRHVGERVRIDLGKKGLPQSRCVQVLSVNRMITIEAGCSQSDEFYF